MIELKMLKYEIDIKTRYEAILHNEIKDMTTKHDKLFDAETKRKRVSMKNVVETQELKRIITIKSACISIINEELQEMRKLHDTLLNKSVDAKYAPLIKKDKERRIKNERKERKK
jgi:hypothetical protein